MSQVPGSVGHALYNDSLTGGAQALGRNSGSITSGNLADLLTLDAESMTFCGCTVDQLLDCWLFCVNDFLVRDVWSAVQQMVVNARHIKNSII